MVRQVKQKQARERYDKTRKRKVRHTKRLRDRQADFDPVTSSRRMFYLYHGIPDADHVLGKVLDERQETSLGIEP
jgi:hypothetical protein